MSAGDRPRMDWDTGRRSSQTNVGTDVLVEVLKWLAIGIVGLPVLFFLLCLLIAFIFGPFAY